jgi:multiple sugar transport system permease protein
MGKAHSKFFFFLPLFSVLIVMVGYPLAYTMYMSFFKKTAAITIPELVGINNYILLLQDNVFLKVVFNTFVWTITNVVATLGIGLILSLILSDIRLKGIRLFRMIIIIPWSFSVPGMMAWVWLMSSDYGYFNELLKNLGLIGNYIAWLSEPKIVLFSCVIPNVWHMFPYMTVMLLAGLQSIPIELYDAAAVDGVNKVQKFVYITLPQLAPTLLVATTLYMIWTMNSFVPYVLVPGGLANNAVTLPIYIYHLFFTKFDFGSGSAAATFLFLLNLILTILYIRSFKVEWK